MRILHITTRHIPGGAARNLCFTVQRELELGWEVHVAAGEFDKRAVLPDQVSRHVVSELGRGVSARRDLAALTGIRALVRLLGCDVVHTHQSKAGILGRVAVVGTRAVAVHTVHMASFGAGYSRPASWVFRALEMMCARRSALIIFVGRELAEIYVRARVVARRQVRIVRSPIDVDAHLALRELPMDARVGIRSRLGLSNEDRVILVAGLLERRKRTHLVLSRLAPMLLEDSRTLVVAGAGPEEGALRRLADQLGVRQRVLFLGHVEPLDPVLAVADVLVHAAESEGVAQVVVQALAAGIPVVATDVEGLREIEPCPVRIVDRAGQGLAAAVRATLESHRYEPPDDCVFSPWRPAEVRRYQDMLHGELVALCH